MTILGEVVCAGLATVDLVQRVAAFPGPDQKVIAEDAELNCGGPAAVAALTSGVLGARTTLITALGSHPLARTVGSELREHGVDVLDLATTSETAPPISAVSVHAGTGQRSVVSRNAVGRALGGLDTVDDALARAKVLLIDGHYPELAERAVHAARQRDVPVLLDAGSWKPGLTALLHMVDFVACSADFRVPGTRESAEQGPALLQLGVRAVAVTRGAQPVLWWRAGTTGSAEVVVPGVRAVDTVGAGDVFHGALAFAMRESGWIDQLPSVIKFAVEAASERVQHVGRTRWVSTLRDRCDLRVFP